MGQQQSATVTEQDEFIRVQLEVDAVLDIPDDHDLNGPTGPEDQYFILGQAWTKFFFTGALFTVREYMRPSVQPYADPTLSLADCIGGMAEILALLESLDPDELAKAADGVFRARRYSRQHNPVPTPNAETAQQQRSLGARAHHEEVCGPGRPLPWHDRQFGVRLHASNSAINKLRNSSHVEEDASTADTTNTQKVRLLAQAWAIYYVTGLAHVMGGTQGESMASIADPNTSPDQCIKGLDRVRDRLIALTPAERATAFALMDDAHTRYVPEFEFVQA